MTRAARWAAGFLAVASVAAPAVCAAGERHALLVGVGRYSYLPKATLEGPPFDATALQQLLTRRWGFAPEHVSVLLDEKATKPAILAAIDDLAARTRPGDFIFIYFSGHGTSGYDQTFKNAGMDLGTGALVPADFKMGSRADLGQGLIIGSRDLRPRLMKLDGQRDVMVAFDSCFSGNAARALYAPGQPRFLGPEDLVADGSRSAVPGAGQDAEAAGGPGADASYPYQSLVYLSAASKSERAMDISGALIKSGRIRTVDGQPHGAFTNALILGLDGSADTNRDGTLTNEELYRFVKDEVTERFPHQPQMLLPDQSRDTFLRTPVFGAARGPVAAPAASVPAAPPAPPPSPAAGSFRVKLQGVSPALADTVSGLPGVAMVSGDGAYDLLLARDEQGFKLAHPSGDVLASYDPSQLAEVLKRISRQVALRSLIELRFPDQPFNATVEIPGNRGFLREGEPFTIDFTAERASHVLVVDIDNEGFVSVLYPFDAGEARPVRKGRVPSTGDLKVGPPFGTDYVKLFAFEEKPAGFDQWLGASGKHFPPTGPELGQLLRMITTARGGKAQARLKVVTRGAGR